MNFLTLSLALGLNAGLAFSAPVAEVDATNASSLLPQRAASMWSPSVGDKWQIVLENPIDASKPDTTGATVFDIDLFDNAASTIAQLHKQNKKVICYFSAGSYEPWRSDAKSFVAADKGKGLDGWPQEKWLNTRSTNVRNIMIKRLQLAKQKGCDGVDPDNVDAYNNGNGLGLTKADAVNYLTFLSAQAATLNLAIGLKNAGEIVSSVVSKMQFAVNEQCVEYDECGDWSAFIKASKPVYHIEYAPKAPNVPAASLRKWCTAAAGTAGYSTILKTIDLDGQVQYCNGIKATSAELNN